MTDKILEDYYDLHKQLTTFKQQNSILENIIFKLASIIQSISSKDFSEENFSIIWSSLTNDEFFMKALTQEELKLVKEIHQRILD